jgi:formylglycine-generating enzyme required for sulfatase activity
VKATPVTAPAITLVPELVRIPGGSFQMGSKTGEPDEQPVHKVALSPFGIGRYEVTNAQYELYDPNHRRSRDGYSWRNNEPVIYVSWRDAAGYCNWLSRQTGLTPAYDEKTWEINLKANGFRLPTEAEWEYVASGRGQERVYPWGNQQPDATRGNFSTAGVFADNPALRSQEATGVMAVGSYPLGASRDGVMDLAGNVAEWCNDWYNPYTAAAQTDPCSVAAANHRAIRGGSWGYYGFSQRCADREFNSQNYPGYIYLGFRIVLPADGWQQLLGHH